uniref:Uncharacterized protein n=1 Tax=Rhizophora mucronata TaxID=61149 RepID=A0A2P2N6C2_RHIMU
MLLPYHWTSPAQIQRVLNKPLPQCIYELKFGFPFYATIRNNIYRP